MKLFASPAPTTKPINNAEDTIFVAPNERGGWSLFFLGESPIGNYATAADAETIARLNVTHVRVLTSAPQPEPSCA